MVKKKDLKCYTLKAKDGHKYVTCDDPDRKRKKAAKKRPPPPPVPKGVRPAPPPVPKGVRPAPPPVPKKKKVVTPKKPKEPTAKELAADAMAAVTAALAATNSKPKINTQLRTRLMREISEEVKDDDAKRYTQIRKKMEDDADTAQYARIRQKMEEDEKKKTPAKKKPMKPANFNMLRPEIRKNILSMAGNPKKILEEKIEDDKLAKDIKIRAIDGILERDFDTSLDKLDIVGSYRGLHEEMYNILPRLEKGLGIDKYMRFLPKLLARLESIMKRRKEIQAKERQRVKEVRKPDKDAEDARKASLGDDDVREFEKTADIRAYLKWDKEFAKKLDRVVKRDFEASLKDGKSGWANIYFDGKKVKAKNRYISELEDKAFPRKASYNDMKKKLRNERWLDLTEKPIWVNRGSVRIFNI